MLFLVTLVLINAGNGFVIAKFYADWVEEVYFNPWDLKFKLSGKFFYFVINLLELWLLYFPVFSIDLIFLPFLKSGDAV